LPIFAAAAALLVGRRSMKDILLPRAWQHRQTSGNAPLPHFVIGSKSDLKKYIFSANPNSASQNMRPTFSHPTLLQTLPAGGVLGTVKRIQHL
jgi:hypothetical protein